MRIRRTLQSKLLEGFTLAELLTVLAIVGLFAGMVLVAGRSTSEAASIARSKAELASIGASLEAYRRMYGDYPQTGDPGVLLQCLIGKRGPTNVEIEGRAVIGLAHLNMLEGLDPFTSSTARAVDPWMQPYRYAYKTSSSWTQSRYVLHSAGPDRASSAIDSTGTIDPSEAENRDNIYQDR